MSLHRENVLFCFVLIVVLRPGKQFFSHVETEPPIPGYYQYFWGVNRENVILATFIISLFFQFLSNQFMLTC